ncbi:MAG: AAA family ATPase [Cyclobacteriaceae bacterium]|nr:AAA family ATPase [Cyclobacteriaceae bacterium]
MTSTQHLQYQLELIKLERAADLDQYRQKVLLRSLTQRVIEGVTWYPVKVVRDYVGTGERTIIEVERLHPSDKPHSFQSGKSVNIFCNAFGKPEKQHLQGVINYVHNNTLVITINPDELPEWMDDGKLGVDVMFDEMSYKEMEYALKSVSQAQGNRIAELRELFLGATPVLSQAVEVLPAPQLNQSQQAALQQVLAAQDLAFIHGPPGTGKTTTLVQAILQTQRIEGQVLVSTPSNAAIDLLVEKLSEQGLNVVRIGHPARVTDQTLTKTLDARIATHAHYAELRALRKRIEKIRSEASKFKRTFGHHEREHRRLLKEEVKLLKSDADMLEFYIVNDVLQHAQAICCTLVGASHPVLRGRKFKTVFIDEAAQSLEAACWIPMLRAQRVILAGDHCQLPPTIKSNEAAKAGLAITLFERGIEKHPQAASLLQIQYRMHEAIMKFSSQWFYDGKLIAHPSVKAGLLKPHQQPVEFIDTAGCGFTEKQDPETLSRYNEEEAALVISETEKLVADYGVDEWNEQQITLGIITPYRAQVDYLNKLAAASSILEPLGTLITIHTVDAFQGQERDAIVISFVRSNDKAEVGFLADIRRTNVAMTRARKKLLLIGDSATLAAHPFYEALLNYVQQNGFYKSAFEV